MHARLLFLSAIVLVGCGARTAFLDEVQTDAAVADTSTFDAPVDTFVPRDARIDSIVPPRDTSIDSIVVDVGGDTGSTATTGDLCKRDVDCDKDGSGTHKCILNLYPGYGNFDPTPVCVLTGCGPGSGSSVVKCDGDRGICLNAGSAGLCLPTCTFDNTGAPPIGCAAKDACNVFTVTSATEGIGFCFGGCKDDGGTGGCVDGNSCQVETGYCVRSPLVYSKKVGEACTSADASANRCNCLYPMTSSKGFCSAFCEVGVTKCDVGFTCTALLPASFGKSPVGIGGYCAKPCTSDTDCTGLNSTCQSSSDGKVCLPFPI